MRILLGCGAAGAIAGIFKAPFAGIMFVLEVFMFDLSATTALPLLISALVAATVAYFLMGTDVQFHFEVTQQFGLSQLPFYVVLGVFCALVSVYFLRTTDRVEQLFARFRKPWVRLLAGGLVLGVLAQKHRTKVKKLSIWGFVLNAVSLAPLAFLLTEIITEKLNALFY